MQVRVIWKVRCNKMDRMNSAEPAGRVYVEVDSRQEAVEVMGIFSRLRQWEMYQDLYRTFDVPSCFIRFQPGNTDCPNEDL